MGVAKHIGNAMTFKILTDNTKQSFYRSEVHSALDHNATNLRIDNTFEDETTKVLVKYMQRSISDASKATQHQNVNAGPTDGEN